MLNGEFCLVGGGGGGGGGTWFEKYNICACETSASPKFRVTDFFYESEMTWPSL